MNPTLLAIVLLAPPALFGVLMLLDQRAEKRASMRRHPSARR